jgi:hypothetical protein
MAKSKSFFGLRSGSTKSLTFQVYRGQQITKDRVTQVSNPRSEAQMNQRALIPIVAAARSALKDLVDHSFEGVPYGEASLREFSKMNLRAGALEVTSFSPNGVSNPGFANLIVSNGTINGGFQIKSTSESTTVFESEAAYPDFYFPAAKKNDPATAIFKYLETYAKTNSVDALKPGTQLTFLSILEAGTVNIRTASGSQDASLSGFVIDRFMIPSSETGDSQLEAVNGEWKLAEDLAEGNAAVRIINSNNDVIAISCIKVGADNGKITFSVNTNVAGNKNNNCGGALIISRYENGTWRRSSSAINIGFEPKNKYTFEDWLSVYQTTGAASKKYLNHGAKGNGLKG